MNQHRFEWFEFLARDAGRKAEAKRLAVAGKPVRTRDARYGLEYLISPDLLSPGQWRATTFRARVPQGHCCFFNAYEAFLEALRHGQEIVP